MIDKDALIAEIKRKINNIDYEGLSDRNIGQKQSLYHILSFLNTLEVKEVDLEQEIHSWMEDNTCRGYCSASIPDTAEHFFELGMQQPKNDNNNEE